VDLTGGFMPKGDNNPMQWIKMAETKEELSSRLANDRVAAAHTMGRQQAIREYDDMLRSHDNKITRLLFFSLGGILALSIILVILSFFAPDLTSEIVAMPIAGIFKVIAIALTSFLFLYHATVETRPKPKVKHGNEKRD
jgi:hypothetical protein